MPLSRRHVLRIAVGAAAFGGMLQRARAQDYPARPVRIIVGYPPGGTTDLVARLIGQYLSERLGQPFVVENRPGAGSNIATEAVVKAAPDGYTLLLVAVANTVNATLFGDRLAFNFLQDIAPVAGIIRVPNVMSVHPSVPATTVPDFIAYAKSNPGKINMASEGKGGPAHMSGELFKMMTGVDMVHVPYRGGAPALTDLIGGQVQVAFVAMPPSLEHIKAGKLRALAVTTAMRSAALPDIPTVGNFVPGFETSAWAGIGAPRATSADVVERLNRMINAALRDATIKARLADLGGAALAGSAADFGRHLAGETEKWGKVVRFAGLEPD